ncbi:MAG: glycosyltransferase [Frankiales bacterium]|nr:glycosyltransferase [Frankiales bacterium]
MATDVPAVDAPVDAPDALRRPSSARRTGSDPASRADDVTARPRAGRASYGDEPARSDIGPDDARPDDARDAGIASDHDPDDVDALDEDAFDDVDHTTPRAHRVTAVIVTHDGARWLPAVLTALSRSTRRPDRVVAVDTGSEDTTVDVLHRAERAGLVDRIVTVARETPFGAAVAAGLATGSGTPDDEPDVVRWAWLLHDDSAPAPTALDELLLEADRQRSVEVLGPKVRGWRNRDVLVECGVTVARSGNRVTGLERRELDQGQHDDVGDVLAVSSAGMLVRRDVWDALGGFDPSLPMFRDDVDFCWRARRAGCRVVVATSSVVHHREAATHGRRQVVAGDPPHGDRPRRIDRAAAIHLMRAHATGAHGLLVTVRLLLGSLLRALALLLAKAPQEARDEWGAFRDAVRDRSALRASRARVAHAAALPGAVPERDVRTLLAPRGLVARHAIERLADLVAGRDSGDPSRSVLDSTPDDPDGWYADDRRPSRVRRFLARPGALVVLVLLAVSLVGVRGLLGSGYLMGGALLPAPDGAGDLWQSYLSAWHEVGPGSAADAPPWLVPLAALALVLRGSAPLAVDVVLLGLVPLAGLTSYLALRGVVSSVWVRAIAAATYATLPAVTGAISGGRVGTAVSLVLLPWLARSCARLVGVGRPPTWRRAFATSLLLAVVCSFTPVVWLMAVVLAVVAGLTLVTDLQGRLRLAVTALLPVVLLVPWSLRVVREPALLWLEPGLVGPVNSHIAPYDVLLLRPGGAGSTPLWLAAGLLVGGLAAVAVRGGRRVVLAAWAVGLVALLVGVVQSLLRVHPSALADPVVPWPGVATAVWASALIVVSARLVDQLPARLAGASFDWRQPGAAVLVLALLLAPAVSLVLLAGGVDGPLRRGDREVLPAYVEAEMATPLRPRTLVLRRAVGQRLMYDLLAAPWPQLGDLDVAPPASVSAQLDKLVARLAAGLGADEVDQIATHGIRYVVLADAAPRRDPLAEQLDGQRGLRRLSSRDGAAVWQVVTTATRVQVIEPTAGDAAGTVSLRMSTAVPVQSPEPRTPTSVDTTVPSGQAGRTLVVAETADSRWTWTVDGASVTPVPGRVPGDENATDPALQQAGLVAPAVPVTLAFDGGSRAAWLWGQAAAVLVVVLLALPSRRTEDDDDADTLEGEGEARTGTGPDDAPAPDGDRPDPAAPEDPVPGSPAPSGSGSAPGRPATTGTEVPA